MAHYVEGGFEDEAGNFIPGYNLTISTWEILNEIEGEHGISPQLYVRVYDAIVAGIRRWAPRGSAGMKFMGLALEGSGNYDYVSFFLNKSNHAPGTPVDFVSFHHYASSGRDGGANGSEYNAFFSQGDGWLANVAEIQKIRDASDYPNCMLDADEVGVILADDNDPKFTASAPGFPAVYWNAAAAMYAYLFGTTAALGLDILGESQLIGYPSIPFTRGPPINGPWTAPPQFPSVSLLSWGGAFGSAGDGTARYWALKLLVDNFRAGPPAGAWPPAQADVLVSTSVAAGGGGANPFCGKVDNLDTMGLACSDAGAVMSVDFADYGTPTGACGAWARGACSAANASAIVKGLCEGKGACAIPFTTEIFGDPCLNTFKYGVVQARCSSGGGGQVGAGGVYAQAFVEASGARKVLIVNKGNVAANVSLAGAKGAAWQFIDESTAFGPAQSVALADDTWVLAPFALGLLRL